MNTLINTIETFFASVTGVETDLNTGRLWKLIQFICILALIYITFKILNVLIKKFITYKCTLQTQHIVHKGMQYAAFTIIVLTIFNRLGINISAILGAAGIAGIAIGFAAQTSVSNVISGLFVITERAFKIGDVIEISGTCGTVQEINLLSVVLKTFDNQYVRVPNETIIKANLINYSHFPFRRVKTELTVPYGTDLRKLEADLLKTVQKNHYCVADPAPSILWTAFSSTGIHFTLCAWTKIDDFVNLRNSVFMEIDEWFKKEGIEIPFTQTDVYIKERPNRTAVKKTPAQKTKKTI